MPLDVQYFFGKFPIPPFFTKCAPITRICISYLSYHKGPSYFSQVGTNSDSKAFATSSAGVTNTVPAGTR